VIRFYRQIRQRLLTDNKFSKYLLYAVGEILLVVIGISGRDHNSGGSKTYDSLYQGVTSTIGGGKLTSGRSVRKELLFLDLHR
jgi:uncharacterized membrane protein YczE